MVGKPVPEGKHGTRYVYVNYDCRCPDCTEANRVYCKGARQRRSKMEPPEHGTVSSYRNYVCRCGPCTKANSDACKEYQRKIARGWKRP